jgi:rhodanese-related sulfurtransferase
MLANAYGYEAYNLDGGYGQWLAAGQKVTGNNVNPTSNENILKEGFKGVPAPYAKQTLDLYSIFANVNKVASNYNLPKNIQYNEFNSFLERIGVNARLDGNIFKELSQNQNISNNILVATIARFVINGAVNNLLLRDIPVEAFDAQAREKLTAAINDLSDGMGFLVGHIMAGKIPLGTSPYGLSRIIEKHNGNVQLIDARHPLEYEGYHVPGAINVFSDTPEFLQLLSSNRLDKNIPTIFICNSGARASEAAYIAKDYGFQKVYDLAGGTVNWVGAGLPTVLTASAISSSSSSAGATQPQQAAQQPAVQVMPGALVPPGAPTYTTTSPGQQPQPVQTEQLGGLEALVPEEGFGGGC